MNFYPLIRPLLFLLDPEVTHHMALRALRTGLGPTIKPDIDPVLHTNVAGIDFLNPVGLAAGFDKNADVIGEVLGFGFGFVEIGSITPLPQPGNPLPRLFRHAPTQSIINRFGFNSEGIEVCLRRVEAFRDAHVGKKLAPIGLNVGKNKDSTDATADYVKGITAFAHNADYLTVNISSPNTPGLRDLQGRDQLRALLDACTTARDTAHKKPPLFVKIAPDQTPEQMDDIAEVLLAANIQGVIIGNTTVTRPTNLPQEYAKETGGLSGKPLFDLSTQILGQMHHRLQGKIPLIGCGGIFTAEDAYAKIKAGASLVQLYSALIYEGPTLVERINHELAALLRRDGYESVSEAVGTG